MVWKILKIENFKKGQSKLRILFYYEFKNNLKYVIIETEIRMVR